METIFSPTGRDRIGIVPLCALTWRFVQLFFRFFACRYRAAFWGGLSFGDYRFLYITHFCVLCGWVSKMNTGVGCWNSGHFWGLRDPLIFKYICINNGLRSARKNRIPALIPSINNLARVRRNEGINEVWGINGNHSIASYAQVEK